MNTGGSTGSRRGLTAIDWIAVGLIGLAVAILGAAIPLVAPRFLAMFRDFGEGPLPLLTRLVLTRWFPPVLATLPTALVVLGVGHTGGSRALRRGLIVAAFLVGLAMISLCLAGLYLPLFALAGAIKS